MKTKYPLKSQRPLLSKTQYDKPRSDIKKLKKFVLKNLGGEGFQVDWFLNSELTPEEVSRLMSEGVVSNGRAFKLKRMATRRCHTNSATLAEENPNIDIYTGLALSRDGVWRVHSWVYDNEHENFIETTERRVKYFGYKLNEDEREKFIFQQLGVMR